MYRNYRRKGYRAGKRAATKAKKTYKKKSVSSKVSRLSRAVRIMSRKEEVKSLQYTIAETSLAPYYNMGNTFKLHQLSSNVSTLPIPQNTTSAGRIGNRIAFTSGKIKMNFWAASYDLNTNPFPQPCFVIMYLLTRRDTAQGVPTASLPYFYQAGSTSVSASGFLPDKFLSTNNDLYKIYKKVVFKLGFAGNTGTGAAPGNAYFSNNDFPLNKSITIDFTKYLIKNAKFNDTTSNEPVQRGLWMALECVSATNTGMSVGQYPVKYCAELELKWKDT